MSEYGLSIRMADGVEVLNTSYYGVAMKIHDSYPVGPVTVGIDYTSDPAALSQVEWVEVNSGGQFLPEVGEDTVAFQNMCFRLSAGQWVNMSVLANGNHYYNSNLGMTKQTYSYPSFNDEFRYWLSQIGINPVYSSGHIAGISIESAVKQLGLLFVVGLENNV